MDNKGTSPRSSSNMSARPVVKAAVAATAFESAGKVCVVYFCLMLLATSADTNITSIRFNGAAPDCSLT
jgi:hypothetical protein